MASSSEFTKTKLVRQAIQEKIDYLTDNAYRYRMSGTPPNIAYAEKQEKEATLLREVIEGD